MRRALLTTGRASVPIVVGDVPSNDTSSYQNDSFYAPNNPASGTGTLTTATVKLNGSFSIFFFTVNPATMTVRAISANISATTGLGTYSISLPVVAGDYVGISASGSGGSSQVSVRYATGGTFKGGSTRPAVGGSVSSYSSVNGTICLSAAST